MKHYAGIDVITPLTDRLRVACCTLRGAGITGGGAQRAFDRKFLERYCETFSTKPWACSMSQIDWAGEGYEGTKLAYLASGAGFFYERHRAVNDRMAAIELLARTHPGSGRSRTVS